MHEMTTTRIDRNPEIHHALQARLGARQFSDEVYREDSDCLVELGAQPGHSPMI